jgi:hypothetical protein
VEGGSAIVSGDPVLQGSNVIFTALPDNLYRVKEWTLNGVPVPDNTTNNLTVTGLSGETTVTVEFELIPTTEYNVTFNVDMTQPIVGGYFIEGTDQLWIGTSINGWTIPGDDPAFEMLESATDNIYTLTDQLLDGTYYYKYFKIVGGVSSWDNAEWAGDPNRMFTVAGADVTLDDTWVYSDDVTDLLNGISVNPNPSNGMFLVNVDQIVNLQVTDITGKVLMEKKVVDRDLININTTGVYFMRFWNEKGSGTIKVVVK